MAEAAGPAPIAVHVTPPPDDPAGLEPFDALLRRTGDGRIIVTAMTPGSLPPLVAGQRLVLVTDGRDATPTVQVCGDYPGAADTIVVAEITDPRVQARRATPRVVAGLDVEIDAGEATARRGRLVDVSRSGASVHHGGAALPTDAAGRLLVGVGGFAGNGRTRCLTARVVWSHAHTDGSATSGLHFDPGQSPTISQVLLEARRDGRTRGGRATPTR